MLRSSNWLSNYVNIFNNGRNYVFIVYARNYSRDAPSLRISGIFVDPLCALQCMLRHCVCKPLFPEITSYCRKFWETPDKRLGFGHTANIVVNFLMYNGHSKTTSCMGKYSQAYFFYYNSLYNHQVRQLQFSLSNLSNKNLSKRSGLR